MDEAEILLSAHTAIGDIITQDVLEEEKRLAEKAKQEEMELQRQLEEQQAQELKEQRYKRLLHLLNKSEFYACFLKEKLEKTQQKKKQKEATIAAKSVVPSVSEKKAHSSRVLRVKNETVESQEKENNMSPVKKSGKSKRKLVDSDYDISSVISEEAIKKARRNDTALTVSPVKSEIDTDKTRVTELGYTVSERQPLLFEGGVLRDYQLEGLEWLKALYENAMNGILADEMGLGKTLQVIALICHLIEMRVIGPFLVIAPLSTLPNWIMEFKRFAPKVPVVLFHGNKEKRAALMPDIRRKYEVVNFHRTYPVVVTSYQIPLSDSAKFLESVKWTYVIVDEGHRLKNHKSMLARALRRYGTANRLLLTGTPIQNDLTELWSLLNFLLPEIFNELSVFESWFEVSELQNIDSDEKIIEQEKKLNVLSTMHQILTPFLLRRVKSDVELNLPPKKEVRVYCPMTETQMILYTCTLEHSFDGLKEGKIKDGVNEIGANETPKKRKCVLQKKQYAHHDDSEEEPEDWQEIVYPNKLPVKDKKIKEYFMNIKMQNPMMQLRKLVNHPYLVKQPVNPDGTVKVDKCVVTEAGKMLVLDTLLPRLKARGHKVLIFSTFTMMLDIIEDYLVMRNYAYSRLDGSMKYSDRIDNIQNFNQDSDVFVFLISTRAGGLGLNLTSADTVIIYDSDWNPQCDLQAQDRCHRIGQTKPVVVYRFITKASIDERIVERAAAKRKLEKMVIHKGKFKHALEKNDALDLKELKEMLNANDHQKVVHSGGSVLSEEEITSMLDRSDMIAEMSSRN